MAARTARVALAAGLAHAMLIAAPASRAQTDFFWNAPNGGSGAWNTSTANWSTTATATPTYTWTNSGSERANFGNTAGTVTLGVNITAFGVVFSTTGYT